MKILTTQTTSKKQTIDNRPDYSKSSLGAFGSGDLKSVMLTSQLRAIQGLRGAKEHAHLFSGNKETFAKILREQGNETNFGEQQT